MSESRPEDDTPPRARYTDWPYGIPRCYRWRDVRFVVRRRAAVLPAAGPAAFQAPERARELRPEALAGVPQTRHRPGACPGPDPRRARMAAALVRGGRDAGRVGAHPRVARARPARGRRG